MTIPAVTTRPEPRIIGGMFGLPGESDFQAGCTPPFLAEKSLLLANARSGIALLVERLAPAQVWVPSYLCAAVVRGGQRRPTPLSPLPKREGGTMGLPCPPICFYEVGSDLTVRRPEWLEKVQAGDLVVLVDYFGLPGDAACAAAARERGAWVLEDASQALLSPAAGRLGHFALFSPRKFLGVPDGGILVSNCQIDLAAIPLAGPPSEWWLKALTATVLRREFDLHGGDRRWFELFQQVEREQPIGRCAMSELSRLLLAHAFDYPAIAAQRVDNYRYLAGQLGDIALFPDLPAEVVPLGFPIRSPDRDAIRQRLFAHEIYPPLHWPLAGVVPAEFKASHRLSNEIMTLPCDQRYERQEMGRMAQLVRLGLP